MLEPYKLVFVNSIAFFAFIILVYLSRKNKKLEIITLLFASLLPLISLLRKGVYQSGDFAINISKTIDLYNSLSYGIFPVHWASILNATYGYPLFLFTYPLPYYSISLFKFLGFSFITGEKLVIAITFILSGIGMYLSLKTFLKPLNSLFGAILYLFAPYHLVDMHFRVALGEVFAYAALPFVFYFLLKLSKKLSRLDLLFLIISFSALMLSHQAISLVSAPFIILLPLFLKSKRKNLVLIYSALFLTFLITSFYWLPVIEGVRYTHQVTFSKNISFENFWLYLTSPWRYGFLYQGPIGQLSFPAGFVQLGLAILGLFYLFKKKIKKLKKTLVLLFSVLVVLVFMLTPFSAFLWNALPFMTNFQFSYRLMLPVSFVLSIIGAVVSTKIKLKGIIYLLIFLAIAQTILNWGTRTMLTDIDDQNLEGRVALATYEGEGLQPAVPKWRDIKNIWMKTPPEKNIEILSGSGVISNVLRTPVEHRYLADITKTATLVENTYYFPGWTLYINGKPYKSGYIDSQKTDLIRFSLNPGVYEISLLYLSTPTVLFANIISLASMIFLFLYLFLNPHKLK